MTTSKSYGFPLRVKNRREKNGRRLTLVAQKKGFDAMNTTQKITALCTVPFLKKSRKTAQNGQKWSKWLKISIRSRFFLILSEMVLCTDLGLFALYSVHQTPSFELSKSTFWQFFFLIFHPKKDPYDFGVVKSYPECKILVDNNSTKNENLTKWNRKMSGRSFNITSVAFGDTLAYTVHWVQFTLSTHSRLYTVHCSLATLYILISV